MTLCDTWNFFRWGWQWGADPSYRSRLAVRQSGAAQGWVDAMNMNPWAGFNSNWGMFLWSILCDPKFLETSPKILDLAKLEAARNSGSLSRCLRIWQIWGGRLDAIFSKIQLNGSVQTEWKGIYCKNPFYLCERMHKSICRCTWITGVQINIFFLQDFHG